MLESDEDDVAAPLLREQERLLRPAAPEGCRRGGCPRCPDLRWAGWAAASVSAGLAFFVLLGLMSPGAFWGDFGGDPLKPPHRGTPMQHLVVDCAVRLVESIPEGLAYNSTVINMPTYQVAWVLTRCHS